MHVICYKLCLSTYKAYLIWSHFILLCYTDAVFFKGKTLHQQKMTHFIVVICKWTHNIFEVGL